jgi:hypothetical protein
VKEYLGVEVYLHSFFDFGTEHKLQAFKERPGKYLDIGAMK